MHYQQFSLILGRELDVLYDVAMKILTMVSGAQ
jgi:hypothetical protein